MELDFDELQNEYNKLRAEYEALLKQKQEYDEVIKRAYADPELRDPLKKIVKKTANIEIEDPPHEKYVKDEISKLEVKLEEMRAEKEKEARAQYAKQLENVLTQYDITGDEIPKFRDFVSKTGLIPTTPEGWEIAAKNYRRSLVAEPRLGITKKFKDTVAPEDYLKNPSAAFERDFLNAMQQRAR